MFVLVTIRRVDLSIVYYVWWCICVQENTKNNVLHHVKQIAKRFSDLIIILSQFQLMQREFLQMHELFQRWISFHL